MAAKYSRTSASGRPFPKGKSGNPKGRPKGIPNKATLEVKEWARNIFDDVEVQAQTLAQAKAGTLPPGIFTALLAYAYGKPKDTLEVQGNIEITRIIEEIVDPKDDEDDE